MSLSPELKVVLPIAERMKVPKLVVEREKNKGENETQPEKVIGMSGPVSVNFICPIRPLKKPRTEPVIDSPKEEKLWRKEIPGKERGKQK